LSWLVSGFVAVVEEFAGATDPCVAVALVAWPKRKGTPVASIKKTKTQPAANDRLIPSPRDIEKRCQQYYNLAATPN
jgi:hypothetical protein